MAEHRRRTVDADQTFWGYIVPLALIAAMCSIVSSSFSLHRSIVFAVVVALGSFIIELVGFVIVAYVTGALSRLFSGTKDQNQALKLIAYSCTSRWVAGIAALTPLTESLISLLGVLYSLYLLRFGVVSVTRVPPEKAVGFTIVVILATIVLFVLIGVFVGLLVAFLTAGAILSTGGAR